MRFTVVFFKYIFKFYFLPIFFRFPGTFMEIQFQNVEIKEKKLPNIM